MTALTATFIMETCGTFGIFAVINCNNNFYKGFKTIIKNINYDIDSINNVSSKIQE
jgi:hypothetical protein